MKYHLDFIDACMYDATLRKSSKPHVVKRELSYRIVENATILPTKDVEGKGICGGVVDGEDNFLTDTGFHVGKEGYYDYDHTEVDKREETALYLGFFYHVWGHAFTDNLKHLWFIGTPAFKELCQKTPIKLVYACDSSFHISKNFGELLGIVGLNVEQLEPADHLVRYRTMYIPDVCFYTRDEERFITPDYIRMMDKVVNKVTPSNKYEKIYLTRTQLKGGTLDFGEKSIEGVFRKLGYRVIAPEKYSVKEQIAMMRGCRYLAATEGSISHNAVFLADQAHLIIIRKGAYVNEYQFPLNEMRDLDVTYIDAHLSVFTDSEAMAAGPFYLYVNDNLCRFANIQDNSFSFSEFKRYTARCMLLPHFERRVLVDSYYYQKFSEEIEKKKSRMRGILRSIPFLSAKQQAAVIQIGKKLLSK